MASYASQCFPARSLTRFKKNSDGGAWLIAYKQEQKRRFEAVLLPSTGREEIGRQRTKKNVQVSREKSKIPCTEMNGIYLLRELRIDDPSDLASFNIVSRDLITAKKEDFVLFDNVVHIEAGENQLDISSFKTFPVLRSLELQLNNISTLNLSNNDFPYLEDLDLSFNSVTESGVFMLGALPVLKRLCLTGNNLKNLPMQMTRTINAHDRNEDKILTRQAFGCLEELHLDENEFEDISVFARLANLHSLRVLNLAKNHLKCVPHLRLLSAQDYMKPVSIMKDEIETDDVESVMENPFTKDEDDADDGMIDEGEIEMKQSFRTKKAATDDLPNGDLLGLDFSHTRAQCPFLSLEKLDISHNEIADEDALLPLATWPALMDVNLWDNPLIKSHKGVPTYLNYHLSKLCGINLNRKEPHITKKPLFAPAMVPAVKFNKVDDIMPPMRRKNLLMVEFESYEAALQSGSLYGKPLPPINANVDGSENDTKDQRSINTAPAKCNITESDHSVSMKSRRPHSVARDQFFDQDSLPVEENDDQPICDHESLQGNESDGVFLTQVDVREGCTSENSENCKMGQPDNNLALSEKNVDNLNEFPMVDEKSLHYEDLLQIEDPVDDIDTPPAADVRSNINALKNALNHPLVFSDTAQPSIERHTYTQHKGVHSAPSKNPTKRDRIQTALNEMRGQRGIIEENLDTVLERYDSDPQLRKKFPEVKKLLKEVQSKYNKVRVASLETASNAQKILKNSNKSCYGKKLGPDILPSQARTNLAGKTRSIREDDNVEKTMTNFKTLVDKRI